MSHYLLNFPATRWSLGLECGEVKEQLPLSKRQKQNQGQMFWEEEWCLDFLGATRINI